MPALHRHALPALLVTGLLALSGCSAGGGGTAPQTPDAAPTDSGYPVTVDNCGTEVTLGDAPERIVAIKSTSIEMVLALGLGDRLVGTAFADGPVPDGLADGELPVMSDQAPGEEAVLEREPDLVYAGWESNLTGETAGDRDQLADLGIATYVSPAACKEPAYRPVRLSFEDVFGEMEQAGEILGARDAAKDLVDSQREALAAVTPDDRGLSALWYSSGSDVPYVGAGIGAPQMILDAVGLENVAGDVDDTWSTFGWESVVAADPDVIVLVDASWNTAESKRRALAENPATAQLEAVRNERYLIVPFAASEAGVRNVDAVSSLAEQLAALDIPAAPAG